MPRSLLFLLFPLVMLTVVGGGHWYLWSRLVRDAELPLFWHRALTAAFIALALLVPTTMFAARSAPRLAEPIAWAGFIWFGTGFFLIVAVLSLDLIRGLGTTLAPLLGAEVTPERRRLFGRVLAGVAGSVGLVEAGIALATVRAGPVVRRVEVWLERLPKAFDGFTIGQINDVHLGATLGPEFMEGVVSALESFKPDLVAIVGDLVDGSVAELSPAAAPLARLKPAHGTFFVTGNHEYYSGVSDWLAHLPTLGIRPLRNEHLAIEKDGASFVLAGTDDLQGSRFGEGHGHDLERALAGRDGSKAVVLLSHQPKSFPEAAAQGVDLQLSGHTHGGQFFPWGVFVKLQQGFLAGLDRIGAAQLYTSPGTGYWGPPMRLGTRSEVTQLVLRSGAKPA